jgi:hypothetical protein
VVDFRYVPDLEAFCIASVNGALLVVNVESKEIEVCTLLISDVLGKSATVALKSACLLSLSLSCFRSFSLLIFLGTPLEPFSCRA